MLFRSEKMSKPKTEKTETKPETIETISDAKLVQALNQQYATIIQAQQAITQAQGGIQAINREFERRTTIKETSNG